MLVIIDHANGDEQIIQAVRVVIALVTKNSVKLNFDFSDLIHAKMVEMHPNGLSKILSLLLDLALN